jgi:glycosyltransferase involved in cell wall biosynthesis
MVKVLTSAIIRDAPVIAEGLFSFQIGGSERVAINLALEFNRRGYQVVCFAFQDSDGPMRAELERSGIRCLDMNYGNFRGPLRWLRYQWHLWRMLRRERVRALHVHHHGALVLCGIPAWLARIPRVVMTEHGLQALQERPRARRLASQFSRYADAITLVDPTQVTYFHTELGVATEKLFYISNGVHLRARPEEAVKRMREKLGIAPEQFTFFFVGRLNEVKDLGTLMDAFAGLPEDLRARARLYMVGEGPERTMLQTKRAALALDDKVVLLGARDDISDLLMAADAFVMSSRTEGLPMVLLEAMAAGVPCAATAVGGIPALFGNDRGLLVRAQHPAELAAAMAELASSPETRARLVANARENLIKNHTVDSIVDRYLELLGLPPACARTEASPP